MIAFCPNSHIRLSCRLYLDSNKIFRLPFNRHKVSKPEDTRFIPLLYKIVPPPMEFPRYILRLVLALYVTIKLWANFLTYLNSKTQVETSLFLPTSVENSSEHYEICFKFSNLLIILVQSSKLQLEQY